MGKPSLKSESENSIQSLTTDLQNIKAHATTDMATLRRKLILGGKLEIRNKCVHATNIFFLDFRVVYRISASLSIDL